jgi:large subunit ribosomal protein L9
VFLQEVEGSGHTGEVKSVADGFARNYLLPRKLAAPATDHNIRVAQSRASVEVKQQAKLDADAAVLADKLVGHKVTLTAKAGPQGRLYGSVTPRDIAEALEGPLGLVLEHRQVELGEPIRQVGVFEVPLRLSRNIRASVQVEVLGEGMPAPEAGPSGPAPAAKEEGTEPAVAMGEEAEAVEEETLPEAAELEEALPEAAELEEALPEAAELEEALPEAEEPEEALPEAEEPEEALPEAEEPGEDAE